MKPSLRVVRLADFLRTASPRLGATPPPAPTPIVHSTPARNVFDILENGRLKPMLCSVFRERLCYFFVGRPAYKWSTNGEASRWQLPFVLVMRRPGSAGIKRMYPFDTGAFAAGRLPDYLVGFDMENYGLGTDISAARVLIDVFFGTDRAYVEGKAKSDADVRAAHALGAEHQEVEALARLYGERSNSYFDDRARTIEVQVEEDVSIAGEDLIGVVIPQAYAAHPGVAQALTDLGCQVEAYGEYPLRVEGYHGLIYEAVVRMLRQAGIQ